MKRLILCLDGTWNNPFQEKVRADGRRVLKPSNPLKLARAVQPVAERTETVQVTYYDSGVGALGSYPGLSNRIVGRVDSWLGGAYGAGFEANIEQAVTFLVNNYLPGDEVFLFGFSRGAAEARGLARFLAWLGGIPQKGDAYFVPLYFRLYLETKGRGDPNAVTREEGQVSELVPTSIKFLGVWDTVMSLGSRFRATRGTSEIARSFHVGEEPATGVLHVRQALAIDEQRYDFRPEVWLRTGPAESLEQRWFAGVHSNVGGGYVEDGLANIAFRWILEEAERFGLATNPDYVKHYRKFPQGKLRKSKGRWYRALEFVRWRRGRGVRSLVGYHVEANLVLDRSVIHRLRSDPKDHPTLDLYRPENVFKFLRTRGENLPAYLAELGLDVQHAHLPPDVMEILG